MKYELGQTIYYMLDGRAHSAPVLARMAVENAHEDWACTSAQKDAFTPFGKARIVYATCHGLIEEPCCHATKEGFASALCAA